VLTVIVVVGKVASVSLGAFMSGKGTKITAELPLELELSPGAFPAADPKRR